MTLHAQRSGCLYIRLVLVSAALALTLNNCLAPFTRAFVALRNHGPSGSARRSAPKGRTAAGTSALAMSAKPQAILWDVDGTLVDSTPMAFAATNEVLRRGGYPEISEAEYKQGCIYTTPRRMAFHVGKQDLDDPIGVELAATFDELYVGLVSPKTVPLYPGVGDLLREVATDGCRLGALSNACGEYVRAVLETHGFSLAFEVQLGADEVSAAKPAPDGLLHCCKELGLDADKCVYVGDAPTDGQAARAAGMRCIGVLWGSHGEEQVRSNFDEVADSAATLRRALGLEGTS